MNWIVSLSFFTSSGSWDLLYLASFCLQVQCVDQSAGRKRRGAVQHHRQAGDVHFSRRIGHVWAGKGDPLLCRVQWLRLRLSLWRVVLWGLQGFLQEKHTRWANSFYTRRFHCVTKPERYEWSWISWDACMVYTSFFTVTLICCHFTWCNNLIKYFIPYTYYNIIIP